MRYRLIEDLYVPAGIARRAVARAIDTFVLLVLALGLMYLCGGVALVVLVVGSDTDPLFGESGGSFEALWVFLAVPALWLAALPEVRGVARSGRTLGMRRMQIKVVAVDAQVCGREPTEPSARSSRVRFVVPHGCGLLAAAVCAPVCIWTFGGAGALIAAGVGVTVLSAVYMSSLIDERRRGWHDRAAGTMVVDDSLSARRRARRLSAQAAANDMDARWQQFMGSSD